MGLLPSLTQLLLPGAAHGVMLWSTELPSSIPQLAGQHQDPLCTLPRVGAPAQHQMLGETQEAGTVLPRERGPRGWGCPWGLQVQAGD